MYIYHALINALSVHIIHINLNTIFYTHIEHSPTKTFYIRYYMETHTHTHKHPLYPDIYMFVPRHLYIFITDSQSSKCVYYVCSSRKTVLTALTVKTKSAILDIFSTDKAVYLLQAPRSSA